MGWSEFELQCLTRKNMEINLLLSEVQSRLGLKLECDWPVKYRRTSMCCYAAREVVNSLNHFLLLGMRTRTSTLDGWSSTSPAPNLFVKGHLVKRK